jgi:hypothetical protein
MRRSPTRALLLALVPACYDTNGYYEIISYRPPADDSSSSSTDESSSTTIISTVTTMPPPGGSDSDSDATAGDTASDTEGARPNPQIADLELTPDPVFFNGPLTVTVTVERAEGVSMQLEDGAVIELDPQGDPAIFQGTIPVHSGLANGEHLLKLTPWREDLVGAPVEASYTIALPPPGVEIFWENSDLIGDGIVKALDVSPSGELIELGSYQVGGESRCYLRRRDKGGSWSQSDLRDLMPGVACSPVDVKVAADGAITALAYRTGNNGQEWWLGEIAAWGGQITHRGLGDKEEIALALAMHPSGVVAVCGATTTGQADVWDAAAWIFRPNQLGESRAFDYMPGDAWNAHKFTEVVRDCAFAGDTLVTVGEAYGKHENGDEEPKRDRYFFLEFDMLTKAQTWTVGGVDLAVQSGARALTIDDSGRYITAGYFCGDECDPVALLRVHDPKGGADWFVSIGELKSLAYGPHDIAWSPAGYVVVAMGGDKDNETAFSVLALRPGLVTPLWTYSREDNDAFHMARAVAVGAFGEVYAGGLGKSHYPAVVYLGG